MENVQENKNLSRKRFVPMLAIMFVGIIFIVTGNTNAKFFRFSIYIFDFPNRTPVVYFVASVIGLFHFFYITKHKQHTKHTLINSSLGIVDSMFSAWGYALVVDKAMNVGSGLLKELFGLKPFFAFPDQVDYWSIGLIVLIILFIGVWKIYQMGVEAVFEISHSMRNADPPKKD